MDTKNIRIYQSFYETDQIHKLEPSFIPYDNTKNPEPLKREFPIFLDLYEQNKDFDGYWGLTSWKWREKTQVRGSNYLRNLRLKLKDNNYDVVIFNPYPHLIKAYNNPFVEADDYHHKGMVNYIERILGKMNVDVNIRKTKFDPKHFSYCSFYIGTNKFWDSWMKFLLNFIELSKDDEYFTGATSIHLKFRNFTNFPFIIERLPALFLHLNSEEQRVLSLVKEDINLEI